MKTPATYIWYDNHGEGLNRYGLFRRNFELDARPEKAELHLFADERYRLIVNGRTVCHGPARYKLGYPEYDTVDIAKYLEAGENVIAVMVCAYGQRTFITDLTHGGFIAWGEIKETSGKTIDFSTGPEWKAIRSQGHLETEHKMTFAIGLPELLDARKLAADWAEADFD
ncbi:MAG: sugar-binding domain-containing protein, partial [Candidatus Sumerlaeota bacterium]